MNIKIASALLLFACIANADVVTSTMCAATGFPSVSNPASCQITIPNNQHTMASISGGSSTGGGSVLSRSSGDRPA